MEALPEDEEVDSFQAPAALSLKDRRAAELNAMRAKLLEKMNEVLSTSLAEERAAGAAAAAKREPLAAQLAALQAELAALEAQRAAADVAVGGDEVPLLLPLPLPLPMPQCC